MIQKPLAERVAEHVKYLNDCAVVMGIDAADDTIINLTLLRECAEQLAGRDVEIERLNTSLQNGLHAADLLLAARKIKDNQGVRVSYEMMKERGWRLLGEWIDKTGLIMMRSGHE